MKVSEFTALIVDDEEHAREMIALLLANHFPWIDLIDKVDSVDKAVQVIQEKCPDLLFLDVEMGDGTGFDLLEQFPGIRSIVVFVTAYDKYAIQAIRVAAFDYLLKPLNDEEFKLAVRKAIEKNYRQPQHSTNSFMGTQTVHPEVRKIGIPSLTGLTFVEIDSIVHCQAESNYTHIYFEDGSSVLVSYTLSILESKLKGFGFVRIHHKNLINLKAVKSYLKGKAGGVIVLKNGTHVEVSARRKPELMKILLLQGVT